MSVKTKAAVAAVITLASLDSEEQAALAVIAKIKEGRESLKLKTETDVKAEVEASMKRIGTILGREINLGELLPIVNAMKAGKSLFASNAATGDRTKLDEAEKTTLRAHMLERAAAYKAGRTPKALSEICREMGISTQTPKTYLPSKAQVDALPGSAVVPETAYYVPETAAA